MRIPKTILFASLVAIGLASEAREAAADVRVSARVTVDGGGLEAYGRWVDEPRYGEVFMPDDASYTPYTRGRWVARDRGMTWVSGVPFGDVTERSGRWTRVSRRWAWIPDGDFARARAREARQRRAEDAERRAEDAERARERALGIHDPYAAQERRDAQAERRLQQQERRRQQMLRRGGYGADPAADRRDRERDLRDAERDRRAHAADRRDGFR